MKNKLFVSAFLIGLCAVLLTAHNATAQRLNDGAQMVFLPLTTSVPCGIVDDFSSEASGWFTGSNSAGSTTYTADGEYRILMQDDVAFPRFEPTECGHERYEVSVDLRWEGEEGFAGGLIFGSSADRNKYYALTLKYDNNRLHLREVINNVFPQPIPVGTPDPPVSGTVRLTVVFDGPADTYRAFVDSGSGPVDFPLSSSFINPSSGGTFVGVIGGSDTSATRDLRFDNFSYLPLPPAP